MTLEIGTHLAVVLFLIVVCLTFLRAYGVYMDYLWQKWYAQSRANRLKGA